MAFLKKRPTWSLLLEEKELGCVGWFSRESKNGPLGNCGRTVRYRVGLGSGIIIRQGNVAVTKLKVKLHKRK